MTTARVRLSDAEIRRLVKGEDADERAAAVHKFCRSVDRAELSDGDRAAAQAILRLLAQDTAELVRRALAVTLRTSDLLPRDAALKLTRDVDAIAVPVIEGSPVFTDEDLIEIVRAGSAARQVAVARRPALSVRVTGAVAVHGVEEAVRAACANDDAAFDAEGLGAALDRFAGSAAVTSAIAWRAVLPAAIAERLVSVVSDSLRAQLIERHGVRPAAAHALSAGARERATIDVLDHDSSAADLPGLVAQLNRAGRLTPSLLLRALARGHMGLFEHALAELAGVPHQRTWLMVHDAGPLGLKAIYERAGLPARLFNAFRAGVDTWKSLDGVTMDRPRFQERMLQRFLTQQPFAPREDLTYLLEKLDRTAESLNPPLHANAA
ncbi:MAG TPA: DUF2336 domain-containing protein [Caulobacteraceae bacterium]|nr:DUF2336 domain-containing protein [Caulobacteraceae bacterium]